jgi:hypothetical protein
MIGLSLSRCIKDVIEGRMRVETIDRLVTGTRCVTEADWTECLNGYAQSYWRVNPQWAIRIVRSLRELGRIEQPRCSGRDPAYVAPGKHWITGPTETLQTIRQALRPCA